MKTGRIAWVAATYSAIALAQVALCAVISCAGWDAVDARSQQPVTGNPCGNLWHPCTDSAGRAEGTCCPNGEACGPTCPADECCDERDELARGDAALPAPRPVGRRRHL